MPCLTIIYTAQMGLEHLGYASFNYFRFGSIVLHAFLCAIGQRRVKHNIENVTFKNQSTFTAQLALTNWENCCFLARQIVLFFFQEPSLYTKCCNSVVLLESGSQQTVASLPTSVLRQKFRLCYKLHAARKLSQGVMQETPLPYLPLAALFSRPLLNTGSLDVTYCQRKWWTPSLVYDFPSSSL